MPDDLHVSLSDDIWFFVVIFQFFQAHVNVPTGIEPESKRGFCRKDCIPPKKRYFDYILLLGL
jgi:hypothetical protein